MADRKAVMAALRRHVEQAVATIAVNVTAELVEATPVDTGWARANWIPSVGAPVSAPSGSEGSSSTAAQADGQAEVLGYKLEQGKAYVSNHVPYIRRLNAGHSKQAPAGFVQVAIAKAIDGVGQDGITARVSGGEP